MRLKTYDIYFFVKKSSDHKGFSIKTKEKAIHMAEDIYAGENDYISEFAGGTIAVIDSDGETVWSKPILEKNVK